MMTSWTDDLKVSTGLNFPMQRLNRVSQFYDCFNHEYRVSSENILGS